MSALLASLLPLAALAHSSCNRPDSADDEASAAASTTQDPAPGTDDGPSPTTGPGQTAAGSSSSGDPLPSTDPSATSGDDPLCGNGQLDDGEVCDGADLDGKQCPDVAPGTTGTLACDPDCASLDSSGCAFTDPGAAQVVLNEVTSKAATAGPFAAKGDAVELFNAGGAAVDLAGWRLSDDPAFPEAKTYVFPPGSSLAPGAFLVLVEFDDLLGEGELPFGISATTEETLTLRDADDATRDVLILEGAEAAVSYCRLPDGAGAWQRCDQTLGEPNLAASQTCGNAAREGDEACDGADLGGAGCVDVGYTAGALSCAPTCALDTSMCQSSSPVALNELESNDDRIELHNAGAQPVDLSGWILTDAVVDDTYDPAADLKKMVFPAQTSLAGQQFLVVTKGLNPGQHPFGLSAEGDAVTLMKPDLTPISHVSYGVGQAAASLCRLPDGPTGILTVACTPTYGAANEAP